LADHLAPPSLCKNEVFKERRVNGVKTVVLLGALSALLLVGGEALAGRQGLYLGLGIAVLMNFVGYFFSEKIALSMYSAQPVT
jgi:heat shock protein HtpX